MSKIKVLEVIRQGQIGGGESHLLDLVTFLDKGQFEPVCLAFTPGEMVSRLEAMGIQCHVIDTLKPFDVKVQRQIIELMQQEKTGRERFGMKDACVIENGINLVRFNPDGQFVNLREQFGFTEDDFVAGFIARCTKQKAPLDFLEAVRLAHQQNFKIKGLFVGEGDMDAEVDAFIAGHQMSAYVYRSKFRTDVPDLLHSINVYCLPSLWEGLSIALLEAMAMGKAIVATPTDGTKEVITHEDNGLVIPYSQPQALADAILRFYEDHNLYEHCGNRAHALVAQRFNAQRVSDAVGQIYREVVK